MQCICGLSINIDGYGFYKCKSCSRVYGVGENGYSYQGFEKPQDDDIFPCPSCCASGHLEMIKDDGIKCVACGVMWHKITEPQEGSE